MPPQLEKNHVVPTAWQDEALASDAGLISFRMDWFDLLAVQGTLKSLLQHHSWEVMKLTCAMFLLL